MSTESNFTESLNILTWKENFKLAYLKLANQSDLK